MMQSATLVTIVPLLISFLTSYSSAKPANVTTTSSSKAEPLCSSQGFSCHAEDSQCCDGLTCLVSGDDKVKRCFLLLPSVEYEEVSRADFSQQKWIVSERRQVIDHRMTSHISTQLFKNL